MLGEVPERLMLLSVQTAIVIFVIELENFFHQHRMQLMHPYFLRDPFLELLLISML